MVQKLETLFADWPFAGQAPPPIPTNTDFAAAGVYLVDKDVNQGRVAMMLPGIMRDNPDYFAVMVMNDILGGGGFTSRIMSRVRSDEGLAYDAHSSFPGGVYYPLTFTAGFQSKSRTVAYAASLVLEEMKHMAAEPVSDAELSTSPARLHRPFPAHVRHQGPGRQHICPGRIHRPIRQGPGLLETIPRPASRRSPRTTCCAWPENTWSRTNWSSSSSARKTRSCWAIRTIRSNWRN